MTQPSTITCGDCGQTIRVVPVSDWEFEWRCLCGNAGLISWAHAAEPPTFNTAPEQQELFDASAEIIHAIDEAIEVFDFVIARNKKLK